MKTKFILLVMLLVSPVFAQDSHETKSEVKELSEFHDVIYQIWHTAWPEKNIQLLKDLYPDVQKGFQKIKDAKLTGILRDKKEKWEEGVKKMGICVKDYETSITNKDDAALLNAAEKLHSQFEMLVRVVRPVMPSIEIFHQELYMLYHHYIQKYDYATVKNSVAKLKEKCEKIMEAKLSERLKSKEEVFNNARSGLEKAVKELFSVSQQGDNQKNIVKALDAVHSRYQELEKVFD